MSVQYKRVKNKDGTYRHTIVREKPREVKTPKTKPKAEKAVEDAGAKE